MARTCKANSLVGWLTIVTMPVSCGRGDTSLNNTVSSASGTNFSISQSLSVPPSAVTAYAISSRPNPMRGSAVVEMAVPRASNVRLSLVDLQGREVRQFAAGNFSAGRYTFNWDGHTSGRTAAAGLYFLRYETPARVYVQRLVMTR